MAQLEETWRKLTTTECQEHIDNASIEAEAIVWEHVKKRIEEGNIVQMSNKGRLHLIPIVPGTISEDLLKPNEMPVNSLPI